MVLGVNQHTNTAHSLGIEVEVEETDEGGKSEGREADRCVFIQRTRNWRAVRWPISFERGVARTPHRRKLTQLRSVDHPRQEGFRPHS